MYYGPGSFYGTIPAQPSLLYMYNILGNIYQRSTPIRFKVIIINMMSSAYTLYLYNSLELGYILLMIGFQIISNIMMREYAVNDAPLEKFGGFPLYYI